MQRVHALSRRNRERILHRLQDAADAGSVPAGEALVRLSILKELVPAAGRGLSTRAAIPGQAAAA